MTAQRIVLLLGGVAAAVALFVIVRPGDEEVTAVPPTIKRPEITLSVRPEPGPETLRITVRAGGPVGGIARPHFERGERIRIAVRADVSDHVHLHGYDLIRDVAPGAPAQLAFTADLVGVFELELEESGVLLAEVEVTP